MTTLHIEHPITDYDVWRAAFDGFEQIRAAAGVAGHRVWRPVDDDRYVIIQLDFQHPERAPAFLDFLRTQVWANRDQSPALLGEPRAIVLAAGDHIHATSPLDPQRPPD
jgi:hypothetical protein